MPNAFWCIVEDDRNGSPKKVMAEVIGEAARLAPGRVEAVWLTDKASEAGLKQLGEWGASRVLLLENAAFAPYRSEVWTAAAADLAAKESPAAIFAPVTSRQREFVARLAARLGVGLSADSVRFAMEGDKLVATRPVYAGKLLSKVTWATSTRAGGRTASRSARPAGRSRRSSISASASRAPSSIWPACERRRSSWR